MKTFFRFIWRNRLYSMINMVGLSVSMAFSIIIFSYVAGQYGTSRSVEGWRDIYAVCYDNSTVMCYGMADAIRTSLPEAEAVTRFSTPTDGYLTEYRGEKYNALLMSADSTFFSMFGVRFKEGDAGLLRGRHNIAISESFARKIGGQGEALLGKSILIDGEYFTVCGIMADFRDGIIPYTEIITGIEGDRSIEQYRTSPFSVFGIIQTFVRIHPDHDIRKVEGKLAGIFMKASGAEAEDAGSYRFTLERLDSLYFSPGNYFLNSGNARTVRNLALAGIALLISALFNYINLTSALSWRRAREMAARRLLGSSPADIRKRYFLEALTFTSLCFIVGILVAAAAVPAVDWFITDPSSQSETAGMELEDIFSPWTLAGCLILVFLVSTAAGMLPAATAMQFSPSDIMKGTMRVKGKMFFSKVFIFIQTIISVVLIALSIIMEAQMKHMLSRPVGCDFEDIYYLDTDFEGDDGRRFLEEIKSLPCVIDAGLCTSLPGELYSIFTFQDEAGNEVQCFVMSCDTTVFNMLGFDIISRYGDNIHGSIWANESAARAAGIEGPDTDISKTLGNYIGYDEKKTVTGITGDFITRGAGISEKGENAVIYISRQESFNFCSYAILTNGDHAAAKEMISEAYRNFSTECFGVEIPAFKNGYMTDCLADGLETARRNMRMIEVFMVISIILSLSGLAAISIFYASSCRKSIALHKVYGGTTGSETIRNIMSYMLVTLLADVVAVPVAVALGRRYLQEFAYKMDLHWWIFAVTVTLSLVFTLISVLWQIRKETGTPPSEALRTE